MYQQSIKSNMKNLPGSILVTGATGFIGSRLISHLSKKGYKVIGMSRRKIPNTENGHLNPNFTFSHQI